MSKNVFKVSQNSKVSKISEEFQKYPVSKKHMQYQTEYVCKWFKVSKIYI